MFSLLFDQCVGINKDHDVIWVMIVMPLYVGAVDHIVGNGK